MRRGGERRAFCFPYNEGADRSPLRQPNGVDGCVLEWWATGEGENPPLELRWLDLCDWGSHF